MHNSTRTDAKNWTPPTVDEVDRLWIKASKKIDIEVSKLHVVFGIGERAARRWRSKANANENGKSIIRYGYFTLLVAIAEERSILGFKAYDPNLIDDLDLPSMNNYHPDFNYCDLIPTALRMSLSEFAQLIGVDYTTIYRASLADVCPKWIYGLIGLALGLSPRVLFQ